jgi:hypothetical protein
MTTDSGPTFSKALRSMNTQTNPRRSTPMRLFSLATLVSSIVFVANRATADSLIIPPEFADREGSLVIGTVSNNPHRYHFLYLGSEFPQEPIDIIGMRRRPKSGTPTQSPIYRDLQVSLTTTNAAALNTDFVANFNMAVQPPTLVINGTVVTSTVRPVPDQSPRAFDYEFLWEETPFRFNPADGTNLLVDFRAPFGVSVPQQHDSIDARTQGSNTPLSVLESPANFFMVTPNVLP